MNSDRLDLVHYGLNWLRNNIMRLDGKSMVRQDWTGLDRELLRTAGTGTVGRLSLFLIAFESADVRPTVLTSNWKDWCRFKQTVQC